MPQICSALSAPRRVLHRACSKQDRDTDSGGRAGRTLCELWKSMCFGSPLREWKAVACGIERRASHRVTPRFYQLSHPMSLALK